jgi:hypothetical protein
MRFERNRAAQARGNGRWCDPSPAFFSGSAQAGMTFSYGEETG